MNLRRAGKGIVRKGKRPSVYRIGFNDGDETELTANGINELEELWRSLCPEFECEPDSVNYVERVGYEEDTGMEEKKIVVYVLHGFWENEFTNGCAVVDVSIDLETVMKKLDEIVESKAREYVKVQEDKAEEERGFRYFEIWDENGQSAKFYIVEQYLKLSQSMMEAIAESLAKGAGK